MELGDPRLLPYSNMEYGGDNHCIANNFGLAQGHPGGGEPSHFARAENLCCFS